MNAHVSWLIAARIKDGQRAALEVLKDEMIDATRPEKGTLAYHWSLSEDGTSCHIYERYLDSDAVMTHLAKFGSYTSRFTECLSPTGFYIYGDPSEGVRSALAHFGPVYYSGVGGFSRG